MSLRPTAKPGKGYRRCAGVVLFNPAGLVFVARRADVADAWQLPQGGIDKGEDAALAAQRELAEETGIVSVEMIDEIDGWLAYDFPPGVGRGRHCGQAQRWFAMRFTGDEAEIDLAAHGTPEFDAWRWVPLDEVPGLIVEFKRPVYAAVAKAFAHLVS